MASAEGEGSQFGKVLFADGYAMVEPESAVNTY